MTDRPAASLPREILTGLPGLEIFRRLIAGDLPQPPVNLTADIFVVEADEGRIVFEGQPSDRFVNPLGGIHGGWIATLLDSAMACAVHTRLAAGQAYTTVEMKVNFVRAVMPTMGRLRCEGRVLHFGNRIATSEGFLRDANGILLAHGTETCLIMEART